MKNGWSIVAFCALWLVSCQEKFPGYSDSESGVYYKIHALGDGEIEAVKGDHVRLHMVYRHADQTLLFDSDSITEKADSLYEVGTVQPHLTDALCLLREGDSATFIVRQKDVQADAFGIQLSDTVTYIYVDVKMRDILTDQEYEEELDRIKWLRDQEMNEQVDLLNYLASNDIDRDNYFEGIYYVSEKSGVGASPQSGDAISIHYRAYFMDGTLFDDTYKMGQPFVFNIGDPDQIIKGMGLGLSLMKKKGGKATFIIPSQLGFGGKGSSTGIVPPFTSLVYEVELISINDGEEV